MAVWYRGWDSNPHGTQVPTDFRLTTAFASCELDFLFAYTAFPVKSLHRPSRAWLRVAISQGSLTLRNDISPVSRRALKNKSVASTSSATPARIGLSLSTQPSVLNAPRRKSVQRRSGSRLVVLLRPLVGPVGRLLRAGRGFLWGW